MSFCISWGSRCASVCTWYWWSRYFIICLPPIFRLMGLLGMYWGSALLQLLSWILYYGTVTFCLSMCIIWFSVTSWCLGICGLSNHISTIFWWFSVYLLISLTKEDFILVSKFLPDSWSRWYFPTHLPGIYTLPCGCALILTSSYSSYIQSIVTAVGTVLTLTFLMVVC